MEEKTPADSQEPMTLSVPAAAALIGVGRTLAYEAARNGQIPVVRIGNRLVVPKRRLLKMLEGDEAAPASSNVAADREPSVGSR